MARLSSCCLIPLMLMFGCGKHEATELSTPVAVVNGPVPTHGFLGITGSDNPATPLLITEVIPGSSAAAAGVMPNDVLRKLNGKSVATIAEINEQLKQTQSGDLEQLEISRSGKTIVFHVRLMSFTDMVVLQNPSGATTAP